MKKNAISKKILLALFLIIGFSTIRGQTCTTPGTVSTNGTWRGRDSFNVSEKWHIIHADHDNYKIKMTIKNFSSGNFTVNLFENNCSLLTSVNQTLTSVGDSVTIITNSLTIGSDYLIRLSNAVPPTYFIYDMEIEKWNAYSQVVLICHSTDCGAPTYSCELVCNGDFECLSAPVSSLTQINAASNWNSASPASPDLFVTGGPSGNYGVPCNAFGTQNAYSGGNYAGIFINQGTTNYSEYLQTQLQTQMVAGRSYVVSFYVSLADRSQALINNIGVWLSQNPIGPPGTGVMPNTYSASLSGPATSSSLLNDKLGWHQVTFCYTATGGESYLTIGSATVTGVVPTASLNPCTITAGPINYDGSYAYIDLVSVKALQVSAGNYVGACGQASVQTQLNGFTQCFSDLPFSYSWYPTAGLSATNIINPVATVTTTSYYTLIATSTDSQGNSCNATGTTWIAVGASPGLLVQPSRENVCTNLGQSSTITANSTYPPNFYYNSALTWQPGSLTGSVVVVTPTVPTIYTVTATWGTCTNTQVIEIGTFSNCCTNTVNALTTAYLAPGTYGDIVINNDLVLAGVNAAWSFTANVLIAPNVKIYVNNINSTIGFRGAHVYSCADMWGGIEITGDNHFISTNNSLIEDAICAVSVVNTNSYTTPPSGTPFQAFNTVFNKNLYDVKIDGYQYNFVGTNYNMIFYDNVFTCRNLPFTATTWPTTATLKTVCTPTTGYSPPYLNASCTSYPQVNLKSPYSFSTSRIAIQLTNCGKTYPSGITTGYNGIQIGDPTTASKFNLFDSHGYFIYGSNSNIYSYNNVFQNTTRYKLYNLPHQPTYGGSAIYSDILSGYGYDQYFNSLIDINSGSNVNPSLGNRFWDCHIAVDANNTFSLNAVQGTYRSSHSTSTYNTFIGGYLGISGHTNRMGGYTINNNYMNNLQTAVNISLNSGSYNVGSGVQTGIYAGNVVMQYNYIGACTDNTVSIGSNYTDHGIVLTAPTSMTWATAGTTGLYVNANTINRVFNGISFYGVNSISNSIVNNGVVLLDENLVFNPQKGIDVSNSNKTTVATNTLNAQGTSNSRVTLVYSSVNTQPKVYCNITSNAFKGFEFNSAHTGTCSWKGNSMDTQALGMTLSSGAIITNQGSTSYPSDNKWNGSWIGTNFGTFVDGSSDAQYSKLYVRNTGVYKPQNPGYVVALQSYAVTTNTPNASGTYSCGIDGGGGPPPGFASQNNNQTMATTSNLNAPVEVKYIADNNLYRYLASNPAEKSNNIAYYNFYNSMAGSNMDMLNQVETSLYNGQTQQAQSLNSSIQPTNSVEDTYKNFYNLFLKNKNGLFSGSDSTILTSIAVLCPDMNGAGVYQARALYNYIYKAAFNFPDNCATSVSSRLLNNGLNEIVNSETKWSVDLFPNPATNNFSIVSKTESESLKISIADIDGRIIYTNSLVTNGFIRKLELELNNGMYLVTVTNSNNESVTKKLIIAK